MRPHGARSTLLTGALGFALRFVPVAVLIVAGVVYLSSVDETGRRRTLMAGEKSAVAVQAAAVGPNLAG